MKMYLQMSPEEFGLFLLFFLYLHCVFKPCLR